MLKIVKSYSSLAPIQFNFAGHKNCRKKENDKKILKRPREEKSSAKSTDDLHSTSIRDLVYLSAP